MSKKCISFVLILIVMFNVLTVNSYAEEMPVTTVPSQSTGDQPITPSEEDTSYKQMLKEYQDTLNMPDDLIKTTEELDNGSTEVTNDNGENIPVSTTGTTYSNSFTYKILVKALAIVPVVVNQLMEVAVEATCNTKISKFTIYDTVIGNYEFFNIDFLNIPTKTSNLLSYESFKVSMIQAYHMMRNLSIAISLLVLIYVGIRMAISTLALDKAKYKKMFLNWVVSLLIIAVMDFIIIFISFVLNIGLDIVKNLATSLQISDIEADIYNVALQTIEGGANVPTGLVKPVAKGWNSAVALITIWVIVYYEFRFFLMYVHRLFEIGFLVAIGPVVTITYSIDKIGDNRAQAFTAWFTELMVKATVQIVHAVTYCVFIASAGVIAQNHPLLAAIFLSLLLRVEKIVRNALSLKDDTFQRIKMPFIGGHKKKH